MIMPQLVHPSQAWKHSGQKANNQDHGELTLGQDSRSSQIPNSLTIREFGTSPWLIQSHIRWCWVWYKWSSTTLERVCSDFMQRCTFYKAGVPPVIPGLHMVIKKGHPGLQCFWGKVVWDEERKHGLESSLSTRALLHSWKSLLEQSMCSHMMQKPTVLCLLSDKEG